MQCPELCKEKEETAAICCTFKENNLLLLITQLQQKNLSGGRLRDPRRGKATLSLSAKDIRGSIHSVPLPGTTTVFFFFSSPFLLPISRRDKGEIKDKIRPRVKNKGGGGRERESSSLRWNLDVGDGREEGGEREAVVMTLGVITRLTSKLL